MAMPERAVRTLAERKRDVLARLEQDADAWVATSGPAGAPHLVPLSFRWDGETLLLATERSRPTVVNVLANRIVQLTLDGTRDVVAIAGTAETHALDEVSAEAADAWARHAGWDPREVAVGTYVYVRVTPRRIAAWRESNELVGRIVMRDGRWLA